jgi:hypothetical protein
VEGPGADLSYEKHPLNMGKLWNMYGIYGKDMENVWKISGK